jgi:ABC-2 type transport system permease protein
LRNNLHRFQLIHTIRRYLKLWWTFTQMSWMADMEYRTNFVLRIFGEVGWYAGQLSIFEVLFLHTSTISGWDVHGMRVFMACLFLSDALYMIFFEANLDQSFNLIRRGDLDLYLTKPVDSQFMVSFRKISTSYIFNLMGALTYLVWAIRGLTTTVTPLLLVNFACLMFFGFVILYCVRFMFICLMVVLQDAGSIFFVWYQLYRLATRPDSIYPFYLRVLVMTVLPVAFFASVPTRTLTEGFNLPLTIASPAMAGLMLVLSRWVWERSLRRYASASS